jgi:hypothetical protein
MLDTELVDAGLVSAKQILIIKEKSHKDTEINHITTTQGRHATITSAIYIL